MTAPSISPDTARLRLAVTGVVVMSLFAALFARLWYLQVMDTEEFVEAASRNQVRLVYEEAPRGRILDRQGRVLVENRQSEAVTVSRSVAKQHPDMRPRLAALLGLPLDELDRRIANVRFSPYKPVPVAEDVADEVITYLREHAELFPGVEHRRIARRSYPNGSVAAHALGYVGEINDRELGDRQGRGYRLGDSIGKSGVELTYESDLRGVAGITKYEVNSVGEVQDVLGRRAPSPGDDVQLTIDLDVQRLAEESLLLGLEAARQTRDREEKKPFVAPAGAIVVLDPRDGSLLALASYPTYDPNQFVNGISSDVFRGLQDPNNHYPLNNRALMGQYSPGSTFKLITAIAAMRKGMIAGNTSITDEGAYHVSRCRGDTCVFRNAGDRSYGRVNLPRAITVSSDVYFYRLGDKFWSERPRYGDGIQDTARDLGFGDPTGVPLPTEKSGRVPDEQMKKELHERYPTAFVEGVWRTGDNINMAIGQGLLVATPLQLANAYATFANGGTLHEPRVVARILRPDGEVEREEQPRSRRRVDLPPSVRDPIMQGLRGVTSTHEGTASAAFAGFPAEFPVAAKTGTAQVSTKQDTALFVAFAPADNPQYTVAVVMEEAGFGGAAAAPVARRVLQGIAGQPVGPVQVVEAIE